MSEQEMRELDAWIAENVMGWTVWDRNWNGEGFVVWATGDEQNPTYSRFYPNEDPAAAMMVLEKCLDKCLLEICQEDGTYFIEDSTGMGGEYVNAETLPLAICLFARALFGKDGE